MNTETKLKAAYICEAGQAGIDRVYSEKTQAGIASLFDFSGVPGVLTKATLGTCDTQNTQVLFSTWGMPTLTESEIGTNFPRLRILFYGAGSVQGFARPFLNRGVTVVSAWIANSVPVIEYATCQILLANKGYFGASRLCSRSLDNRRAASAHFSGFPGNFDTAVGLIGLGAIGSGVARALTQHRLTVLAYDPYCSREKADALGVRLVPLETLFSECQTVSNHVANLPATRNMLDYSLFSRMKPNAVFINTGRGAQVVEADLIRALTECPDRTAVLDVTLPEPPVADSPLYRLDNVVLTPHIAGSSGLECLRMGEYMLEEAERWLSGLPLNYAVTAEMLKTMA